MAPRFSTAQERKLYEAAAEYVAAGIADEEAAARLCDRFATPEDVEETYATASAFVAHIRREVRLQEEELDAEAADDRDARHARRLAERRTR